MVNIAFSILTAHSILQGAAAVPQGVTREDELVIDELVERALADAGGLSFLDQRGMHDALHKFVDKVRDKYNFGFLESYSKSLGRN